MKAIFWKAGVLPLGAAAMLAACAGEPTGHKSNAAERACYDALANRHAVQEEIEFVSSRRYDNDTSVTLRDSQGLWNCIATNDGDVTQFEPV